MPSEVFKHICEMHFINRLAFVCVRLKGSETQRAFLGRDTEVKDTMADPDAQAAPGCKPAVHVGDAAGQKCTGDQSRESLQHPGSEPSSHATFSFVLTVLVLWPELQKAKRSNNRPASRVQTGSGSWQPRTAHGLRRRCWHWPAHRP